MRMFKNERPLHLIIMTHSLVEPGSPPPRDLPQVPMEPKRRGQVPPLLEPSPSTCLAVFSQGS